MHLVVDDAPDCQVGESNIHGLGLFAAKTIISGLVVADYNESSRSWHKVRFNEMTRPNVQFCWFIGFDTEWALVPDKDDKFMFANHGDSPNCLWMPKKRRLVSLRTIERGEEITYDYGLEICPDWWPTPKWWDGRK